MAPRCILIVWNGDLGGFLNHWASSTTYLLAYTFCSFFSGRFGPNIRLQRRLQQTGAFLFMVLLGSSALYGITSGPDTTSKVQLEKSESCEADEAGVGYLSCKAGPRSERA